MNEQPLPTEASTVEVRGRCWVPCSFMFFLEIESEAHRLARLTSQTAPRMCLLHIPGASVTDVHCYTQYRCVCTAHISYESAGVLNSAGPPAYML